MAESEGFEPPEDFSSTVFKTAAFDHSASSPIVCLNYSKVSPEKNYSKKAAVPAALPHTSLYAAPSGPALRAVQNRSRRFCRPLSQLSDCLYAISTLAYYKHLSSPVISRARLKSLNFASPATFRGLLRKSLNTDSPTLNQVDIARVRT